MTEEESPPSSPTQLRSWVLIRRKNIYGIPTSISLLIKANGVTVLEQLEPL